MANRTFKYFSGTTELTNLRDIPNEEFNKRFGFVIVGKRNDGYSKFIGTAADKRVLPVTRVIEYKMFPSLHKCDARCTNAKGNKCECSCGGEFHGTQG